MKLTPEKREAAVAVLGGMERGPERDREIARVAAVSGEPESLVRADADELTPPPIARWRPIPIEALPVALRGYVMTVANAIGVDPSFVTLPVLVTLAGTIGNRARVELKPGWREPAVLWGAIVGRSGVLKSPVLAEVTRPVRQREAKTIEEHRQRVEDYERDLENWSERPKGERGTKPESPTPPQRSLVSDVTIEALAERLSESPAGLLLYRDELAGWVRSFDRYRSGRGGDAQAWLEIHRAGSILVDRKTGGPVSVARAAVSIIGSVQPEVLHGSLQGEHLVDGLAARLLFVMPPERPKRWTDAEIPTDAREAWANLLNRLRTSYDPATGPRNVTLTPSAREAFVDFYNRHADREADAGSGAVAAALSKLEGAAARLALILQLVHDPTSNAIGDQAMKAGVTLAEWFGNEAERLYGRFVETSEDTERRQLMEWIEVHGGRVTVRDVGRGLRQYRGDSGAAPAAAALENLVIAGFGTWEEKDPGLHGGRPTTVFRLGDSGDGDETGFVATGDETSERPVRTGQTPATKPRSTEGVSSPSPPHESRKSAFERYVSTHEEVL